jgi:zinc protease
MSVATPNRPGLAPTRTVLPNGLRVIAKQARTAPAVTIHASVRAGAVFDPQDGAGLAHFVSRTVDRGTERRTADDLAEELDGRGVTLTVTTTRHSINMVCTCLTEDLEAILSLVGEILTEPAFSPSEVDVRRGEIVTLIRQDEDNPAAVAGDALMQVLYGDVHPYGRRVRGTVEAVEGVTSARLRDFHARRFHPEALSLVVVGDVDPRHATETAARVFGGWRASPDEVAALPPVVEPASRRVRVIPMMNKAQADIAYGFIAIARSDPAYYAYWLMNNILGQYSLGGRLGDSIREKQGMAYYVFSSLDASLIRGPLSVRAGVNPANVERAVASIDAELARLAADGPTDVEVRESKQYLIGSLPRQLETNAGIAAFLQSIEFFGLGLDYDQRVAGLLEGVTPVDVHEAARRTLESTRASVVVAGPYAGSLA